MRRIILAAVLAGGAWAAAHHAAAAAPVGGGSGGEGYGTAQLQALWVQAGGSQGTRVNAACHAMQESAGRSWITSPNPDGGVNAGLWQIDTKGKGAGYTVTQLQNPLTNARVAVAATGDGSDWSAWATKGC